MRQRELEEIATKRSQIDDELQEITQSIARYETQLAEIQGKQAQLRKALPGSGLEKNLTELEQAKMALDDSRNTYQKARFQTQEVRQSYNNLLARLERASNGVAAFANDQQLVQSALLGVIKLKNQAQSLQMQLSSLISTWEEYQKAREAREQAVINETNDTRKF